jgi:hypothetical protein
LAASGLLKPIVRDLSVPVEVGDGWVMPVGSWKHVDGPVEAVGEAVATGFTPPKTQCETTRRFVAVIHVGLHCVPSELFVCVPDRCDGGLAGDSGTTSAWEEPPCQFSGPSGALPESASAEGQIGVFRCDQPDTKASEMPDPAIVGESGPCLTFGEWTPVERGRFGVGEEFAVVVGMLCRGCNKAESIGNKFRDDHSGKHAREGFLAA